jgi:16S rRNA (cytidine1402-2'-O)-methyltransferase
VESAGTLVVVGTPIGNIGDLSPRAAEALASADVIACEDTRRTGRLLHLAGIEAPRLLVTNEHTERDRIDEVLGRLDRGQRVALVSDAGMPTVSDPGRHLVEAVAAAGHRVEVVPGPVAAVAALAVSGFRADRFVFEGFLPRRGAARAERLTQIGSDERTVVIYESPRRLARTLADLRSSCGPERPAVVVRELTKLHEEALRGPLADLTAQVEAAAPRGEVVVVIRGAEPAAPVMDDDELRRALGDALSQGLSRRDAVTTVVAATGIPKRRVYGLATTMGIEES